MANHDFRSGFKTKLQRKQRRCIENLAKETNIKCTFSATNNIYIGNAGLANGYQQEELLEIFQQFGRVDKIIMIPNKSYCFMVFNRKEDAKKAYEEVHGKSLNCSSPLYLAFAESVPEQQSNCIDLPPGLVLLKDFITEEEEEVLLKCIDWNVPNLQSGILLKNRRVRHYGFEFNYDITNIIKDKPLRDDIPKECNFLWERLQNHWQIDKIPDQLTVNEYLPGQGIPHHIDTHSACEDNIYSLSLESSIIMEFRNRDGSKIPVLLPQRSLLILSGESRYTWSHGIVPRKLDIVSSQNGGLTIMKRGKRTSFTFRCVRTGECKCRYTNYCDSYSKSKEECNSNLIDEILALELENAHVHEVYDNIADHFSETRHKPWPQVMNFVKSLPVGSILLDVGCGNGKYFSNNPGIVELGCDHSKGLAEICSKRGFQIFTCNCLQLPLRSNFADACMSIAVIHHLATRERRIKALQEISRILCPGGRALIQVWAKNQNKDAKKSSYLKQNNKTEIVPRKDVCYQRQVYQPLHSSEKDHIVSKDSSLNDNANFSSVLMDESNSKNLISCNLPVHENRTDFKHSDLLVPWKLKVKKEVIEGNESTLLRYYHVFQEGELEDLCTNINDIYIVKSYYEQGNWCVIIEKILHS